ncbi:aldo/keto reductase [Aquisalimonas asiatica]|uniref:Predicted oxidoreductase n=1 Tax=Aquisalimonas asiatica TaxID=406100 RepID=A0A1H8RKI1_9GAMM|nr:aldo/keto reductase [Aquisalimonas asiatica]SEO66483.1 Predicted oxidoreductase [Aquisalimonas asiatica]
MAASPLWPDTPFLLGMMRLHERPELHRPERLADWIQARLEQGLCWFDHADIYGDGAGERLFGQALRHRPALARQVRIVTKTGIVPEGRDSSPFGVKHYDTSATHVTRAIDAALDRLGVAHVDHFLIHRPDPLLDAEATGRALDDAITAGKIGAAGVSNFGPEQWRRLQGAMRNRLAGHQLQLSLARTSPLFHGDYDALLADGLQPMAWSPLGGGAALQGHTGAMLERLAGEWNSTAAAIALDWVRTLPGRPLPVIGTLRPERIDELLGSTGQPMTRATWFALLEQARGEPVA